MIAEKYEDIVKNIKSLDDDPVFQKLIGQVHAACILHNSGVPKTEWPTFTFKESKMIENSYNMFENALLMTNLHVERDLATKHIVRSAEILEFLSSTSNRSSFKWQQLLVICALAYYVSGYFARSFVIMKSIPHEEVLPYYLRLLRVFFLKDIHQSREIIMQVLFDLKNNDEQISKALKTGVLSSDDALFKILSVSFCKGYSYFIEFIKTGRQELLETAKIYIKRGEELALKINHVDWWWLYYFSSFLIDEFAEFSLWTNLSSWGHDSEDARKLIQKYIHINYSQETPIIELWPSQKSALKIFVNNFQSNYCIKMPTSSGKTKIAELAILWYILKTPNIEQKCIYIAPYRSLAVEIEDTLKKVFMPLGFFVSEIYGGFEFTTLEKSLVDEAKILIATPEKFDAIFRSNQDIKEKIQLIIVDEGHIIEPPDFQEIQKSRGLKFEFFLQRLFNRYNNSTTRMLFLSAVLPDITQFSEWISGDKSNYIESEWRPSRLLLGTITWNKPNVRIDYTHIGNKPLTDPYYINHFLQPLSGTHLPSRRRNGFPANIREVLAHTALKFAKQGTTLIFSSLKNSVVPLGEEILKAINFIRDTKIPNFHLPIDPKYVSLRNDCIELAKESMGDDCEIIGFLRENIIIHHHDIPHSLRIKLEKLARLGGIKLIIATTTLGQGVNLPIRTILVYNLQFGKGQKIRPMEFWNICGRAGRGMRENEGQILFVVQDTFKEWLSKQKTDVKKASLKNQQRRWNWYRKSNAEYRDTLVSSYDKYSIQSSLIQVFYKFYKLWEKQFNYLNFPEFCEILANQRNNLDTSKLDFNLDDVLDYFDSLLLSLTEDRKITDLTIDTFDELLRRSLLYIQALHDQEKENIRKFLFSRIEKVWRRYPSSESRQSIYKLGFSINDCSFIVSHKESLKQLYLNAANYDEWNQSTKIEYLLKIAQITYAIKDIFPKGSPALDDVLRGWLSGLNANQMINDTHIKKITNSPAKLSISIEESIVYRLTWAFNAIHAFLLQEFEGADQKLPKSTSYFADYIKYGITVWQACTLLAYNFDNKDLALKISSIIPKEIDEPEKVMPWLKNQTRKDLETRGILSNDAIKINEIMAKIGFIEHLVRDDRNGIDTIEKISIKKDLSVDLRKGDRLYLKPNPEISPYAYTLYTLKGAMLGSFTTQNQDIYNNWHRPEMIDISIEFLQERELENELNIEFKMI